MAQEYRTIITCDTSMHLKEPSLGTYKALKMISLRYVKTSLQAKNRIMEEFRLPKDFLIEEFGVEEYYQELLKELFLEGKQFKNVDPMDINIMEVNQAYRDFFGLLDEN